MKKIRKIMVLCIAMVFVFAGCQPAKNDKDKKVLRLAIDQPFTTLNQQTTIMAAEGEQISQFMEGLMGYDQTGKLIPTGAESYKQDGLVYTFQLRKDAVWKNGEPVTANDYEFSWKTMAKNDTGGFRMNGGVFKNGEKVLNKEMDADALGVKAVDDYTLQVELEKPYLTLLQLLATYRYFPVNQKFYEAIGGEESYGKDLDSIMTNGAFDLVEYKADEVLRFQKSDTYWDKKNIKLDEVEVKIVQNKATQSALYDSNEIDILNVTGELIDQYASNPDKVSGMQTRIMYFYLSGDTMPQNKFLANTNLRKAIASAFDKTIITENILKNNSQPLEGLIPEGYASIDDVDFRTYVKQNNNSVYDVAKANEYLSQAKAELGTEEISFEFAVYGSELYTKVYENIKSQIEANLPGVKMELVTYPKQVYYQELAKIETAAGMSTWTQRGGDLGNFSILYEKNGADNFYGYNDPQFEDFVAQGKNANTLAEQFEAYAKAEQLIIDQAVYIPVYQEGICYVVNPRVKNFEYNAKSAPTINYRYLDID